MDKRYDQYQRQRYSAKQRDVEFFLSFEQWCKLWEDSGVYHLRGRGGFLMGRINDEGPYAVDNVEIISHRENFCQAMEKYYGDRVYM
ncbi:hypothetical protein [Bradyrhizobium sp.]|uniref:hypothetical protein n=1 Tax=Bradyrhizobium sp. TaxID=376 RepID=UPI003C73F3E5